MRHHPRARIIGGIALIMLAAAATIVGSIQLTVQRQGAARQQRVTACQVRFNNAYAAVTQLRGRLGDEDRAATNTINDATTTLISSVFTAPPGTTRTQIHADYLTYRAAAARYKRTEAMITATRAAHPFPALPSAACK